MQSAHQILVLLPQHIVVRKHRVKVLRVRKLLGQQKVQQGPQFVQIVLEGGARDQQPILGLDQPDHFGQFALLVLDPVRLVDDQVAPHELLQLAGGFQHHLVGGDQGLENFW